MRSEAEKGFLGPYGFRFLVQVPVLIGAAMDRVHVDESTWGSARSGAVVHDHAVELGDDPEVFPVSQQLKLLDPPFSKKQ